MNITKSIKFLSTTILLLVFNSINYGQKLEPKEREEIIYEIRKKLYEPDHTIISKITGNDYQLYMSFPRGYSTKDTISYPVLYVLDGLKDFELLSAEHKYSYRKIEEIIIIGISSGGDYKNASIDRALDYTTSVDKSWDRKRRKKYGLSKDTKQSGGAANFLKALKTEITPFVEKHYKANKDRGISGHSIGGLFTAYALLNSDGFFTQFGISSPSLWWMEEELLHKAELQFSENKTWDIPPTKVFISVGGKEGKSMIKTMKTYRLNLEAAAYKNIDLKWHVFDDESHYSVKQPSLRQTLIELYGIE